MFDPVLRPVKDRILGPLAHLLREVPPGVVTGAGLLAGLGAALAAWKSAFALGFALWVANRILDGLDGAVARLRDTSSDLGGFLDLMADFAVYGAVPVALALRPESPPELIRAATILLAVFYLNTASWMVPSALLEKRGTGVASRGKPTAVSIPEGLISGGETVVFYSLFFLMPAHQVTLFLWMAGLTGLTILQRIVWAFREFGPKTKTLPHLGILAVGALLLPAGAAAQLESGLAEQLQPHPAAQFETGLAAQLAPHPAAQPALDPAAQVVQAQATIVGSVRAQGGDPLGDVAISFEPGGFTTSTDGSGFFRLEVPSGTEGTLTFQTPDFMQAQVGISPLPPGETKEVGITLARLYALDALTVVSRKQRPLLNTDDGETGGTVEAFELAALPTDARDPLALAFNVPGVSQSTGFFGDAPPLTIHGENSLYTRYTVDGLDNDEGFLGGPRVSLPLAALERLSVHTATYGPALGRSTNGVVEMETRAGGSEWRGDLLFVNRPGIPFDADPKFTPGGVDPEGFKRTQFGGSLGGPVISGTSFVFGALEYTNEREDRIGSTARTSFLGTEERETWKGFIRLDQGWSETQSSTLRVAISDLRRKGQGGGVIVPEADITTRRIGTLTSLTHRNAFREDRARNEFSVQVGTYTWDFPPTSSDLLTPQVTVVSPDLTTVEAVVGSSNFIFDESELQLQVKDELEMRLGNRHTLRLGTDVVRSSFELQGANTNPQGAYTVVNEGNIVASGRFLSIGDVPSDVRVLRYSIDALPQQVDLSQTLWGAFVEDRWRVTPSLTVQLGLRWDYDDITSRGESSPDLNNLQPRGSFNWLATPTSVVRGGWGLYAGKFPYAVYSDAVQFGPQGNAVVTFEEGTSFPPPTFGQGPAAGELESLAGGLPPREVRRMFARVLELPYSSQLSLGYQREVGRAWSVSVDGVWVETRNLPRSWDLNAVQYALSAGDTVNRSPEFGDAYRPVDPASSGYRRLTTTDSGGKGRYLGVQTTLRRALVDGFAVEGSWVWSRTRNDTEDINFNATSVNDFDAEWADGINDRRHHVTVRGVWEPLDQLRASGIFDLQTGTPVNRIAYFRDLDGSGGIFGEGFVGNFDRFPGVKRNDERLPTAWTLDGSVAWIPDLAGGRLAARAEGFNLLNRTNYAGFANGIPGGGPRTQVGRPGDPFTYTQAAPPRQFQFSVQWAF